MDTYGNKFHFWKLPDKCAKLTSTAELLACYTDSGATCRGAIQVSQHWAGVKTLGRFVSQMEWHCGLKSRSSQNSKAWLCSVKARLHMWEASAASGAGLLVFCTLFPTSCGEWGSIPGHILETPGGFLEPGRHLHKPCVPKRPGEACPGCPGRCLGPHTGLGLRGTWKGGRANRWGHVEQGP